MPIEDVAGTVKELIREGKVKYFGLYLAGGMKQQVEQITVAMRATGFKRPIFISSMGI